MNLLGKGLLPGYRCLGFNLVEMMVVLVIVSILAVTAKPFVEVGVRREKEADLKEALRTIRRGIDEFHRDCMDRRIENVSSYASRYCYPLELEVLTDAIEVIPSNGDANTVLKRYLRRIPRDPLQQADSEWEDHWEIRGYVDELESRFWDGDDVYDVRVTHEQESLRGDQYREW